MPRVMCADFVACRRHNVEDECVTERSCIIETGTGLPEEFEKLVGVSRWSG